MEIIEPMLACPKWMGRPERHPRRAVIGGILHVVHTGCAWRCPPVDFRPWQTVYAHFPPPPATAHLQHTRLTHT
ncbi:transposase [Micromonospora sp. NPDC023888]|uniref:transposase n=1 Tax=Micromonospora sp. NPDC023888 TaxID=3155607 RepID=UPI0033CE8D1C